MTGSLPNQIALDDVVLSYGSRPVLNQLSLHVGSSTIYALLGGNGAGKSTTLAALLGFMPIDSGSVTVCGMNPMASPDAVRRQLAYLPENVALYEHLSAVENADYLLSLSGTPTDHAAISRSLAAAGLSEHAWDAKLAGFSKGMRQKVAIAVAMLREVPVLLLDEPTSGLDPHATADFNALLLSVRARGTAVLMVTHDLLSAVDVADRIGFLANGHIQEEVTAAGEPRFDIRALRDRFVNPARIAA